MRCDVAQRALSDRLDDEPGVQPAGLEAHIDGCSACAAFAGELEELRRRLRLTSLEPPPDIAAAVRTELEPAPRGTGGRRREVPAPVPALRAAAVFLLAFVVTAAAVGLSGPRGASAVEVDRLVRAGQHRVDALTADVTVTEHGWHPRVQQRAYVGSLAYLAPERFELVLHDRTSYPSDAWPPNDVQVVIDESRAWSRGLVGCPPSALPACSSDGPRVRVVTGREPFDNAEPVPLELIVPVESFGLPTAPAGSTTDVDGREAVVVEVTVAQVRGLLDGVLSVGAWRELHPSDRVQVALDTEFGIPLRVEVRASDDAVRRRWAATHGYEDSVGARLLSWRLTDVEVNDRAARGAFPSPPARADSVTDRGFDPADDGLAVARPAGLTLHRVGRSGPVLVESWTDGRAWLQVRSHPSWDRNRLFGRRGSRLVRRVPLTSGGVAYVAEGGDEVFLHGTDRDVHLRGSVSTEQLLDAADRLDVEGLVVSAHWVEASSATIADARRALPGLLELPELTGFQGPAVRVGRGAVTLAYAGNGDRGFVLTQSGGELLSPPLDADVLGLAVRETVGRFTPSTGTLEWIEDGLVVSLRSRSLSLGELLAVSERLESGR